MAALALIVGTLFSPFGMNPGSVWHDEAHMDYAKWLAMGLAVLVTGLRAISNLRDFKARWIADKEAFAMVFPDGFKLLSLHEFPMRVVARDPERIIVAKP